jgi:hypothetical protein
MTKTTHSREAAPAPQPEARRGAVMGPCKMRFCSCQRFVYTNDAQFCDNCGHSRSMHQ